MEKMTMNKEIMMNYIDYSNLISNGEFTKRLPKPKGMFPRLMDFEGVATSEREPILLRMKTIEHINENEINVTFFTKKSWEERQEEFDKQRYIQKFLDNCYDSLDAFKSGLNELIKEHELELASFANANIHKRGKITVRTFDKRFRVYENDIQIIETSIIEEAIVAFERIQE